MIKEVPSKQPKEVKIRALTQGSNGKGKRVAPGKLEEVVSFDFKEEVGECLKRKKKMVGLTPQTAMESLSKMATVIA